MSMHNSIEPQNSDKAVTNSQVTNFFTADAMTKPADTCTFTSSTSNNNLWTRTRTNEKWALGR